MGKKSVKAPELKQWEGNAYTNQLEQDLGGYHDWVQNNWQDAVASPNYQDYTDYAKGIYDTQWNDFLNNYKTTSNQLASRNYNRFGGLNTTPALYTQDMYNRQMNDLANRLSSQTLADAFGMANTDYANRMNSLNAVNQLYNYAGNYVTRNKDIPNWNILNQNEVNRVNAENANNQNSGFLGTALGTVGGALGGFAMGGPAGAIAGGLGGLASGLSGNNLGTSFGVGSTIGNYGMQNPTSGLNWLNSKMGYTIR